MVVNLGPQTQSGSPFSKKGCPPVPNYPPPPPCLGMGMMKIFNRDTTTPLYCPLLKKGE